MSKATISKSGIKEEPSGSIPLLTNDGQVWGTMFFEGKSGMIVSRIEYAEGQVPHRRWPLKGKYRQS